MKMAFLDEAGLTYFWSKVKAYVDSKSGNGSSITLDQVYPVGSIYMSVKDVEPSTLFGGTWIRIQGKFLLGFSTYDSKDLGSTGDVATSSSTTDEMLHYLVVNMWKRTA